MIVLNDWVELEGRFSEDLLISGGGSGASGDEGSSDDRSGEELFVEGSPLVASWSGWRRENQASEP